MTVGDYVRAHARRFVAELAELVGFASVSSAPGARAQLHSCARWLVGQLRRLGARDARLIASAGHPVVVGRIDRGRRRPTVLIYGHYDVQPALPAWRPFAPRVKGGYLYGRGASDAKGQLFAHLKAIEMTRALCGRLPVNIVFLIEGEEEIGSPSLAGVLARLHDYLASDVAVVSDSAVLAIDQPSITYSLRGDLYLDVMVSGRLPDLHSGNFGGGVDNALRVLIGALARLYDRRGAVSVPGFADSVLAAPHGPPFSRYERTTIRPSIEIAGVDGGYTGPGVQGVIPSHAIAKLDIRLVPHQDPDRVHQAIFRQLARSIPRGIELVTRERMRARPVVLDRRHPAMQAAACAYRRGFGVAPRFVRIGGSIPAVSALLEQLDVPTVMMGFALPDDGAHGAHERYSLAMLGKAIATSAAFLDEISRGEPRWKPPERPAAPEPREAT